MATTYPRAASRLAAGLLSAALIGGSSLALAPSAEAAAPYKCNASKTECFTYVSKTSGDTLVERVKLTNSSATKTGTFNCVFSKSVTEEWSNTESVTGTAEVTLWGAVGLSLSGTQEKTVSQSASQATSMGVDVVLKPKEVAYCRRTVAWDKLKFKHVRSSDSAAITTTVYATVYSDFAIDLSDTP